MYIYLIGQNDCKFVKIGAAFNIKARLQELQVGNPQKLFLIGAKEVLNKYLANKLEKELHEKFKNHRLNGEWFYLTPEIEEEFKHNTLTAEVVFKDEVRDFRERVDKLPDVIMAKDMKSKLLEVFGSTSREIWIPLKKYLKICVDKIDGKSVKVYKKLVEYRVEEEKIEPKKDIFGHIY